MIETEDVVTQCAGGECRNKSTCRRAIEPVLDVRPRIEPKATAYLCGQYVPNKIVQLHLEGIR